MSGSLFRRATSSASVLPTCRESVCPPRRSSPSRSYLLPTGVAVREAFASAVPTLDAGAQSDLLTGNTGARKFDLGFSQAIPLGNRLRETQAVARVEVALESAEYFNRQRLLVVHGWGTEARARLRAGAPDQ